MKRKRKRKLAPCSAQNIGKLVLQELVMANAKLESQRQKCRELSKALKAQVKLTRERNYEWLRMEEAVAKAKFQLENYKSLAERLDHVTKTIKWQAIVAKYPHLEVDRSIEVAK